jgi:predicted Zn-dependent protease
LNAFAGPGGHIFVHTGLLQHLENESAFAGVVAHELAHVSQRHIASRIEKAQMVNLATLLGVLASVFLGGDAQPALLYGSVAAGQSAMLAYSREDEREADQVGMNYLVAAGFRPQGMVQSFETIRKLRWLGGSFPLYLSTHPGVDERISYLKDRVDRMPPHIQEREEQNTAYQRARMLVMARYTDPDQALAFFQSKELTACLDTLGKAIVFDRTNQVLEASSAFEAALECAPKDSLALREAGIFALRQGDFQVATRRLEEAVLRNPRDLMAQYHYARVYIALGQDNEAISLLERILQHLPEQSAVHALLGRTLGQSGRFFSAHLHLAYAAIYSGDKRQASFHLSRTEEQARSPEDKSALDTLREVFREREEFM